VITSTPFIISRLLCSWAKADLSYSMLTDAFESKEVEEVVSVALQICKSFELERRIKVKRHCIALTDTQRATPTSHAKMNFWVSFSQRKSFARKVLASPSTTNIEASPPPPSATVLLKGC
jgi:hypothetical protein